MPRTRSIFYEFAFLKHWRTLAKEGNQKQTVCEENDVGVKNIIHWIKA